MPKRVNVEPQYFEPDRSHQRKSYDFLDCLFDRDHAWKFEYGEDFDVKASTFRVRIKQWAVRNDCYVAVKIEKGGETVIAQAFELTEEQRWYRQRVQEGARKRMAARRLRALHEQSKQAKGEPPNGDLRSGPSD